MLPTCVTHGHVGISRQGPEGDALLLALCGPGEYFGELALFDEEPRSADAVALDDCHVLFLARAAFRAFLEAHPAALWTCLQVIVRQLRRLTAVADDIALLDLRARLARCLLRLADQGVVASEQAPRAGRPVRITQQHLANMLGATRERVNRQLQALAEEEIIALERGQVRILDCVGLEEAGAADI